MSISSYDAAIALSKNWENHFGVWKRGEKPILRVDSKIVSLAAGAFYSDRLADNLVICGGCTLGKNYPSESDEMKRYLLLEFPIPQERIFTESLSWDTHSNADAAKDIVSSRGFSSLVLIATENHLERAVATFSYHGLKVNGVSAESILDSHGEVYSLLVDIYRKSKHYKTDSKQEKVLRVIQRINPSGTILRAIANSLPTRKH